MLRRFHKISDWMAGGALRIAPGDKSVNAEIIERLEASFGVVGLGPKPKTLADLVKYLPPQPPQEVRSWSPFVAKHGEWFTGFILRSSPRISQTLGQA